jgi:hypothetical protein
LHKFKKRNRLVNRKATHVAQKIPNLLLPLIEKFLLLINEKKMDGPYSDSQIANMDEVPVFWDMIPDKTLEEKGQKQVTIIKTNKIKVRLTVALCCFADGKKLPPYIIFKEQTGKIPKKLIKERYNPKKIIISANKNG